MLTVTAKPSLLNNYLEWYPDTITEPNDVLQLPNEESYFYINKGSTSNRKTGSLAFNIPESSMENIPGSAIIHNIRLIFRTKKENSYGVYDNLLVKYNGVSIANIDATAHNSDILTTEFTTETLNEEDISKMSLFSGNFEIEMSTEGPNAFKLFYILCQITYTEINHSSICKIQCKNGLVVLPLYNPVKLSRYALRVVTQSGIKAFDLVSIDDPSASPLRVSASTGIMAIRKIELDDETEIPNIPEKLVVLAEDSLTKFEVYVGEGMNLYTTKLEDPEDERPVVTDWYIESPVGIKYLVIIDIDGNIRTEFAEDQDIIVIENLKILYNGLVHEITVTDDGVLETVLISS